MFVNASETPLRTKQTMFLCVKIIKPQSTILDFVIAKHLRLPKQNLNS